ncbi:MAG: hypothetical protein WCK35_23660 [Chloroflexota bacterium]
MINSENHLPDLSAVGPASQMTMTSTSGISKAVAMPAKNRMPGFLRPDVNILEILDLERPARSARLA